MSMLQNQKTSSKTAKPMTASQKAKNETKVNAFLANLKKSALVASFHVTKGLRISSSFVGKFVVNLCNNEAKIQSTDTKKVSAIAILNDLRDAKNYTDDTVNAKLSGILTERRIKYYQSRFSKANKCELSEKDVLNAFNIVANQLFDAIAKSGKK